jgi:hypothetical protein
MERIQSLQQMVVGKFDSHMQKYGFLHLVILYNFNIQKPLQKEVQTQI